MGDTMKPTVIKTNRKKETFNATKVYKSIYAACLSTQLSKKECTKLAQQIHKEVVKLFEKQHCLLSEEITSTVAQAMQKRKKELAFMYKTHKDLN